MAEVGKAGARDQTDISRPDHRNPHGLSFLKMSQDFLAGDRGRSNP
jgi:hypothetical protein